ncbi:hypothetical protein P6709_20000, partial [Jeotgalibacillus sp. ET6]|nr:hypothetical protein [Jeotgalibacillus sp. ET6]
ALFTYDENLQPEPGIASWETGTGADLSDDARSELEEEYPDVMDKLKVIGYTDEIPNVLHSLGNRNKSIIRSST